VWKTQKVLASEPGVSCDAEYLMTLLYYVALLFTIIILYFYDIAINVTSPKHHIHIASQVI